MPGSIRGLEADLDVARVWDLETQQLKSRMEGHTGPVRSPVLIDLSVKEVHSRLDTSIILKCV